MSNLGSRILFLDREIQENGGMVTVGYCVESPQDVLREVLKKRFHVLGYRHVNDIQLFNGTQFERNGLYISAYEDIEHEFGLAPSARVDQIPFSSFEIPNLIRDFGKDDLEMIVYANSKKEDSRGSDDRTNIFDEPDDYSEKIDSIKEFLAVVTNRSEEDFTLDKLKRMRHNWIDS